MIPVPGSGWICGRNSATLQIAAMAGWMQASTKCGSQRGKQLSIKARISDPTFNQKQPSDIMPRGNQDPASVERRRLPPTYQWQKRIWTE